MPDGGMEHVDETRLQHEAEYRSEFLLKFIGFGPDDRQAIQAVGPALEPFVPHFVDGMYHKLLSYDVTGRFFLERHEGYGGQVPPSLEGLSTGHELVVFRKARLAVYLGTLLAGELDSEVISYLDRVGRMHTALSGSPRLHVPPLYISAMLAFLADAIQATIARQDHLEAEVRFRAIRAYCKLFWLQNDLLTRHQVPLQPSDLA